MKTECIEKDTKEDKEGRAVGAEAAIYIYSYVTRAPRAK